MSMAGVMERIGRPPTIETPEQLKTWTKKYCDACEAENVFPDFAGMMLWLGLEDEDIERMQDPNNPNYDGFKKAFAYGRRRRECFLARTMTSDNKRTQGCYNALKELINGGYGARLEKDKEQTLNVNVVGVGGIEAFK